MTPEQAQQVALVQQMIQLKQDAQRLRVRDHWEPLVTRTLTSAAGECLALLRQAQAQASTTGQDLQAAVEALLAGPCARVAADKAAQTRDILLDMTSQELRAAVEALTKHGLLAPVPETSHLAPSLAAGPALLASAEKSFREFCLRARTAASQAASQPPSLDQPASWWAGRLKTIAVTVTHAAANRVAGAAADLLR